MGWKKAKEKNTDTGIKLKLRLTNKKANNLHMRKQRCRSAEQRLCFRSIDSTTPHLNWTFHGPIFCVCTGGFVSDLTRKPDCWFSHALVIIFSSLLNFKRSLSNDRLCGLSTIFKLTFPNVL